MVVCFAPQLGQNAVPAGIAVPQFGQYVVPPPLVGEADVGDDGGGGGGGAVPVPRVEGGGGKTLSWIEKNATMNRI